MNSMNKFKGWPYTEIVLPDDGKVICTYSWDGAEPERSLYDANHNLFRLDASGSVVWQVSRDDRGRINWDYIMGEVAKSEKGNPETIRRARKPFTSLSPFFIRHSKYQDSGRSKFNPNLHLALRFNLKSVKYYRFTILLKCDSIVL